MAKAGRGHQEKFFMTLVQYEGKAGLQSISKPIRMDPSVLRPEVQFVFCNVNPNESPEGWRHVWKVLSTTELPLMVLCPLVSIPLPTPPQQMQKGQRVGAAALQLLGEQP